MSDMCMVRDVRRIQVFMDDDLDDQLEAEAAATGVSKASIVRESVAARYRQRSSAPDPIDALVGAFDGAPVDDLDAVIYGAAADA